MITLPEGMTANEYVRELLHDLKESRVRSEQSKALLKEAQAKFNEENADLRMFIQGEDTLEKTIREELLELQKDQSVMMHPAIKSLRKDTEYKFDTKKAVEWCKVNAPILLTVGKEFSDFLKKNEPPEFVEIEETKSVVIASDLSKFEDL